MSKQTIKDEIQTIEAITSTALNTALKPLAAAMLNLSAGQTKVAGLQLKTGKVIAGMLQAENIGTDMISTFNGRAKTFPIKGHALIAGIRLTVKNAMGDLDPAMVNNNWSRILTYAAKDIDPDYVPKKGTPKGGSRRAKKADQSGDVAHVEINGLSSDGMKSAIAAILASVQELESPAFNLNDVVKGLKLAIVGFDKKVIAAKK
jgi:hypothetical protein